MPGESVDLGGKARMIGDMAKRQVVTITDDIDGREGAETVTFAYAGRSYEIDLREKNRTKLEKALEPFIGAARRADGRGRSRRNGSRSAAHTSGLDRQAIRAWAAEHGFEVSGRGRISKKVHRGVSTGSVRMGGRLRPPVPTEGTSHTEAGAVAVGVSLVS
jgi:hypothetical protein